MIPDVFFGIGDLCLKAYDFVVQFFQLPFVSSMVAGLTWTINTIWIFNGIFPVATLAGCVIVVATTYYFKYQIKFFLNTVFPMIPFIGRRIDLPVLLGQHGDLDGTTSDIRRDLPKVLDLRKYRKVDKGVVDLRN